jgi:sRNA-binding carbon storage regulator CsrA
MLVLQRRRGQSLIIPAVSGRVLGPIAIKLIAVEGDLVLIGIEAPKVVPIRAVGVDHAHHGRPREVNA